MGHRRHHRLRRARPRSTGCSPTRRGRSRSPASRTACAATARRLGRGWSTTTSAPSPTASCTAEVRRISREVLPHRRGRRPRSRSRTPSPSCSPASRSTAPTCPRDAHAPRRGLRRRPRATAPTWPTTLDVLEPVLGDPVGGSPPAASSRRQRHGDGQGRRGLRVLPLVARSPRSTRSAPTRRCSPSTPSTSTTRWRGASASGRTR